MSIEGLYDNEPNFVKWTYDAIEETAKFQTVTISSAQLEELRKKVRRDYYGYTGTIRVKITTGLFMPTVISAYPSERYYKPRKRKSKARMNRKWREYEHNRPKQAHSESSY